MKHEVSGQFRILHSEELHVTKYCQDS